MDGAALRDRPGARKRNRPRRAQGTKITRDPGAAHGNIDANAPAPPAAPPRLAVQMQ